MKSYNTFLTNVLLQCMHSALLNSYFAPNTLKQIKNYLCKKHKNEYPIPRYK